MYSSLTNRAEDTVCRRSIKVEKMSSTDSSIGEHDFSEASTVRASAAI